MNTTLMRMTFAGRSGLTALLSALLIAASGCAGLNPERMVPKPVAGSHSASSQSLIGKSLQVAQVTGEKKTSFGGPEYVHSDQFKQALILALRQSGLFSAVRTDHGDLVLYAMIRTQDQRVSRGLQYTATMVVTYRIEDRQRKVIWSKSFESEFSSVAFSGATRTVHAREGCVRENLASFLQGVRESWNKGTLKL